ncbi:protein transport protein S31 [Serendipita sp. 399]|nr:protein transport protein S31 [Serendipita sp. 399]
MKLKEIHRTSTFAWSPASAIPVLATGTVAGALDESFSNDSRLEIWSPNFFDRDEYDLGGEGHPQSDHVITTASRFNRLTWGAVDATRPHGILAGGMENGEIGLWDPAKIVEQADIADASILKNKAHDGAIRGLDFNPIAKNLLASGATNGQIFIWDLKDLTSPYSPGSRSSRLDEITALSWNTGVQQILATASSTGFTVVWDLRGKREVVALSYSAGGGPMQSSRRGQSAVAWHPNNSTRLITASEDDASPIIMLWDLRNARAPEKTLNGHDKGILSLSWCKQDPDLLLSCGKDSRTIAWNPQTGELIGELPAASNWAYQVDWCPRDPNILATASFDGSIGIHSIQSTNQEAASLPTPKATDDVFAPSYHQPFETTLSLKQPPLWMKRPISGTFGYGGILVTVSNLPGASGQNQSSSVHLRSIATESAIIERAKSLAEASKDPTALTAFAEERTKQSASNPDEEASWKALASLFKTGSRDELIALLGFSKAKVASRVAEAIKALQGSTPTAAKSALPEQTKEEQDETEVVIKTEEEETSLETPTASQSSSSLFGDTTGTPQGDAEADFFSSMGGIVPAIPPHMRVPHFDPKAESSAAATIGSPSVSVAPSEVVKVDMFQIYPEGESEVDQVITQALVLGDFESAVELCLSADRFADAILLAVKGGPELLRKTQKAYFERSTPNLPYLRLYQSVVGNDLADVVQNADLKEWQEVFVILCTYATQEEFASLTEQLGLRLEFHGSSLRTSGESDAEVRVKTLRKNATLCYLAARNLEKVVNIWIEEMQEDQDIYSANPDQAPKDASKYTAHAQALQTFIEKVTVFRSAVKYVDIDLETPTTSDAVAGARTYKLSSLYDRYVEYADLLATQGLLDLAATYVTLTPKDYDAGEGKDSSFHFGRERLLIAAGKQSPKAEPPAVPAKSAPTTTKAPATRLPQNNYTNQAYMPAVPATTSSYAPHQPSSYPPNQPPLSSFNAYAPSVPVNTGYSSGYAPYGGGQHGYAPVPAISANSMVPPPPPAFNSGYTPPTSTAPTPSQGPPPPLPAALRKDISGWNDPPMAPARRTPVAPPPMNAPITNPLPNSPPVQNAGFYGAPSAPTGVVPPPRTGSAGVPPPPRAGSIPHPPPPTTRGPTGAPPPRGNIAPPPSTLVAQSQPGYGSRPGSVGPPSNMYDARPPSTGPQVNSRYAPPPRTDSAGPGDVNRGIGAPPPPKVESSGHLPPPPMRGGPYAPPPSTADAPPNATGPRVPPPPRAAGAPPIVRGPGAGIPPPAGASAPPPPTASAPAPAAAPKHPPGDRSHIPDSVRGVYELLFAELDNFKKITPKRTGDDVERRLNVLFDSLNCATLSLPVVQQLLQICDAFVERNSALALQIHLQLLTEGSRGGDDITVWMPALKQLCQRMNG